MAEIGFLTVLVAGVGGVGSALVLYALVRAEHDRPVMDRKSAENAARRDCPDERRE